MGARYTTAFGSITRASQAYTHTRARARALISVYTPLRIYTYVPTHTNDSAARDGDGIVVAVAATADSGSGLSHGTCRDSGGVHDDGVIIVQSAATAPSAIATVGTPLVGGPPPIQVEWKTGCAVGRPTRWRARSPHRETKTRRRHRYYLYRLRLSRHRRRRHLHRGTRPETCECVLYGAHRVFSTCAHTVAAVVTDTTTHTTTTVRLVLPSRTVYCKCVCARSSVSVRVYSIYIYIYIVSFISIYIYLIFVANFRVRRCRDAYFIRIMLNHIVCVRRPKTSL